MKHLKKFNESKEVDIFSDESILNDILLEYVDCGVRYVLKPKAFKVWDGQDFMPIGDKVYFNGDIFNDPSVYKGYQISFSKFFKEGYYATDVQRGENQKIFGKPSDDLYKFFEITKEVQYRIESMGYIFLLSTHNSRAMVGSSIELDGEFDFMIIENK